MQVLADVSQVSHCWPYEPGELIAPIAATESTSPRPRNRARAGWGLADTTVPLWLDKLISIVRGVADATPLSNSADEIAGLALNGLITDIENELLKACVPLGVARTLAHAVAVPLAVQVNQRWAVFSDECEGATLLIHAMDSRRQVSVEIGQGGEKATIVKIDEQMSRTEWVCTADQLVGVRTAVEWLRAR